MPRWNVIGTRAIDPVAVEFPEWITNYSGRARFERGEISRWLALDTAEIDRIGCKRPFVSLAAVADICINLVGRTAVRAKLRRCAAGAWGFGAKAQRGLGTGALFAGASGIGKTFAAEVLAHEVRLDLYHLDLSQLVNKYIGETERNLRRVFDAAEDSGAILLFDEADSLFGKRGEVDKGTDRYANLEVSYLLQRMEQYRGLAILTTNQRDAIDNAFVRRLRFIVRFPFPDVAERLGMWQRAFPAQAPSRGIDASKLARLKLPGGNIRSIALNAAYLAAESGEPISMRHLLNASRAEFAKIERAISRGRRQRLVTPSGAAVENAAK